MPDAVGKGGFTTGEEVAFWTCIKCNGIVADLKLQNCPHEGCNAKRIKEETNKAPRDLIRADVLKIIDNEDEETNGEDSKNKRTKVGWFDHRKCKTDGWGNDMNKLQEKTPSTKQDYRSSRT